ncbi:hypothetical protein AV521_31625 [Streptomyces sp. IMTB 2501]|uniref:hypothetical protein n=1 Tax=Streptomyces sp. IMTB 2501 TaxID=1776340 RepID=UPI00096BFC8C|nr:hypothetical protein [Streptomyces sp. IMTB 2501]OLZ65591.1 hypothetical protein AV521_31625 [Streptomyces sp. IMTB 2501]
MTGTGRHDAAVRRADEVLQMYALSVEGRRRSPGETVQCVLADLLHRCNTQRDFDAALLRASAQHAAVRAGSEDS